MTFKDQLLDAMKVGGLEVYDVARIVSASLPTVRRWMSGKSEPHQAMHKVLFKAIGTVGLVYRLRKRAEIRRKIPGRKSVQEGARDRIADLLEEAANEIVRLNNA